MRRLPWGWGGWEVMRALEPVATWERDEQEGRGGCMCSSVGGGGRRYWGAPRFCTGDLGWMLSLTESGTCNRPVWLWAEAF